MVISFAEFLQSNTEFNKLPDPVYPEYAFIGRSNVGKSSLINMLTGKKGLAKTSGKPGKTITINHFLINKSWYLVDLPGYGFAKRSKVARESWKKMLYTYMLKRQNLIYSFVLIDCRLEPQAIDLEFMGWLGEHGIPFVLVFTKGDKLGKVRLQEQVEAYKQQLLQQWEEVPVCFVSSAVSATGKEEILDLIESENQNYKDYSSSIIN
jgi:GTP-binding protein